ncbi:MAG TPA: aminoglycoside phosphotransferase family protein [Angustibacter sp.]|nr:aminoglycoside phosphotransferase family protein [Angustibacter sp.]
MTVAVPAGLHRSLAGQPEAAAWLDALPDAVSRACDRWSLTLDLHPDEPAWHGFAALVVPVRRDDGTPAALKVTWPHWEATHEAQGLLAWAGDGAVRCLETDGAWTHLLERLHARRDLTREPVESAVAVIGDLLARLHRTQAPPFVQPLADELARLVDRWAQPPSTDVVPRRLHEHAAGLARELLADARDGALLHCDLHYTNVLAADREPWLAIDPKPRRGDPAYEIAPLLWNRLEEITAAAQPAQACRRRLRLACEHAGIEPDRAVAWAVVREVQNAEWAAESADDAELSRHRTLAELLTR